ncbi:MAG: ABC transporter ATP-binding protein, partial [Actinomycetota bacterium]
GGTEASESAELAVVVRRLAEDWGMTVLVVEHDMTFVMDVCDEVMVLDFGRLIASGPPDEVRSNPAVIAAYLGDEIDDVEDGDRADATPATTGVGLGGATEGASP